MQDVLSAMAASNAAYELDPVARSALLAADGMVELDYHQGPLDSRVLVAKRTADGRSIIAVQGTQFSRGELPSIEENLKIWHVDIGGGRLVHDGYWQQLQAVQPYLDGLNVDNWDLAPIVTGHSMGGAVAELWAGSTRMLAGTALITFGAPMCANSRFWDFVAPQPRRWVNNRDFAPAYPYLVEWIEQPCGPYNWIDPTGKLVQLSTGRPGINASVKDHEPQKYLDAIRALCSAAAT